MIFIFYQILIMDAIGNRCHPVDQLVDEKQMLSSLLYRNKNQHSKTVVYKHLSRVKFFLTKMPLEIINDMTRQCEHLVSIINQAISKHGRSNYKKHMSAEVSSRIATLCLDSVSIISVCCHCAQWCLFVSEKIRCKLRQLVFVPLYTVWLCNVARIFSASVRLIKSYYSYWEVFTSTLAAADTSKLSNEVTGIVQLIGIAGSIEDSPPSLSATFSDSDNGAPIDGVKSSSNKPKTASCDGIASSAMTFVPAVEDIGESMLPAGAVASEKRFKRKNSSSDGVYTEKQFKKKKKNFHK